MALYRTGGMIGQISGSIGPNVFSHGRYGPYIRPRVTPVKTGTQAVIDSRFLFGSLSSLWDLLTAGQRAAWKDWAQTNPITNRIGDKQVLSANAAYMMLNTRIATLGADIIDVPPSEGPPTAILITAATATAGTASLSMIFAPSPIPADTAVVIYGCATSRAGQNYFENQLRRVGIIDEAETTPYNALADWVAKIGTLVKDQRLVIDYYTIKSTTGLITPKNRTIITVAT